MKQFFTYSLHLMIFLLSLTLFSACDIHEWPEERKQQYGMFVLDFDFQTELPLHKELVLTRNGKQGSLPVHDVRYVVKAYRTDITEDVRTFVFTQPDVDKLDYTVHLQLPVGTYQFKAWTDFVDANSKDDKYYDTSEFSEIVLANKDNHVGSNDYRDAFRGYVTGVVTAEANSNGTATIHMERPMGKFKFIATDADVFTQTLQDKGMAIHLEDYKVVFRYNLFMPCAFNLEADITADSWTGMSFVSQMFMNDANEVELGYDYIFVEDAGTTMNISVEVYNKENKLIASCSSVDVPVVRNKLTVVKGNFLTSKSSGGIHISPDYDGDFNIEIY